MRRDKRGRIRFTHNGTRYQISPDGTLRVYQRSGHKHNNEQRREHDGVNIARLDRKGRNQLWNAIFTYRNEG